MQIFSLLFFFVPPRLLSQLEEVWVGKGGEQKQAKKISQVLRSELRRVKLWQTTQWTLREEKEIIMMQKGFFFHSSLSNDLMVFFLLFSRGEAPGQCPIAHD